MDVEATRQAVLNLLDNAVKYGPAGQTIVVGVQRARGEEDPFATIRVEDEGPGVPPGQRDRVWDAYVRLDRDRASATAGSGIGLAVVRRVIEAQGRKGARRERRDHPGFRRPVHHRAAAGRRATGGLKWRGS